MSDRMDDVVERLIRIEDKVDARLTAVESRVTTLETKQSVVKAVGGAINWALVMLIAAVTAWLNYLGVKK